VFLNVAGKSQVAEFKMGEGTQIGDLRHSHSARFPESGSGPSGAERSLELGNSVVASEVGQRGARSRFKDGVFLAYQNEPGSPS
jgi:hypothetical protein